jgi:hypothetical protein
MVVPEVVPENVEMWGAGFGFSFFGLRFSRLPCCSLLAIAKLGSILDCPAAIALSQQEEEGKASRGETVAREGRQFCGGAGITERKAEDGCD